MLKECDKTQKSQIIHANINEFQFILCLKLRVLFVLKYTKLNLFPGKLNYQRTMFIYGLAGAVTISRDKVCYSDYYEVYNCLTTTKN